MKTWSPPLRIALARRILETLDTASLGTPVNGATRGVPIEAALGLLRTDREPPDDEECRRIIEEERWTKYGSGTF